MLRDFLDIPFTVIAYGIGFFVLGIFLNLGRMLLLGDEWGDGSDEQAALFIFGGAFLVAKIGAVIGLLVGIKKFKKSRPIESFKERKLKREVARKEFGKDLSTYRDAKYEGYQLRVEFKKGGSKGESQSVHLERTSEGYDLYTTSESLYTEPSSIRVYDYKTRRVVYRGLVPTKKDPDSISRYIPGEWEERFANLEKDVAAKNWLDD